jgi:hypothetical protein
MFHAMTEDVPISSSCQKIAAVNMAGFVHNRNRHANALIKDRPIAMFKGSELLEILPDNPDNNALILYVTVTACCSAIRRLRVTTS